ncbi:hypothetical protein MUG94_12615 [Arthrobacter gengyunqii]|uniref:SAF domain-containing protein n=1 Tax=Arthrobacter gengyunqii TaxID=2886940 RepID=A0A9X1S639_9MICC|nr:hypothetical protein [Arthrobacter gengyunqii]MCC3267959.1 hypothetical protein [Arthrobacter gengyunqii]UOY95381.1 hypothetical protein MUG94_12615 [Arthrobacter gengyunqii]
MSLATSMQASAPRLKKPSWKDPRLLLGILLVLASTAGVVALVGSADQTTEVFAVDEAIPLGTLVAAEDFAVVQVRLGDVSETYLPASEGIPENAVASSLLRKGELLSRADLGKADELDRKPVGLRVDDPLPAETEAGSRVDVWMSMPDERNGFKEPKQILTAAEISELTIDESVLGANRATQLMVLVEDGDLATLLNAQSNGAKIAVVLNPAAGA